MTILIDAMGGDHAPQAILEGCVIAEKELGVKPVAVGNEQIIRRIAEEYRIPTDSFEILHASEWIGMTDRPLSVRSRPDTSLRVGLTALANKEADAFISAGNTGALQMGANLFVRRISGITRSAIGTILPCVNPVLLLDSGANATFTPELLCQYAFMGSVYMHRVHSIASPRVGLLNIGKEEHKGTPDHAQAYQLLTQLPGVRFVGNVEPDALIAGSCDVLVTDGFSGNVLLKTMESMSAYVLSRVAHAITADEPELMRKVRAVHRRFDASEYGGAPLIGISAPVIKAHGASDAYAIKNAIRQAIRYAKGNVAKEIEQGLGGVTFSERRTR